MLRQAIAKYRRLASALRRGEDGQAAVMFALAVVPMLGGVGAAIDYSHGNQVRASLQKALDAAVLAAAIDGTPNWEPPAAKIFSANLNAKDSSVGKPSFNVEKSVCSGSVSALVPTSFMKVFGVNELPVTARSAATQAKIPVCVLALNTFETGAFDMNGNAKFSAPECAVQANTKANRGMTQEGKPTAVARKFGVSGGNTGSGY